MAIARCYVALAKRHQDDNRSNTTFAINLARLTLSEWMKVGVRSSIPEIDRAVSHIQEVRGVSRDVAIELYAKDLAGETNGEVEA